MAFICLQGRQLRGHLGRDRRRAAEGHHRRNPIEYRLPGLTQVQVNDKIELSFARVLRATLRQHPDVILVGEIRGSETADIARTACPRWRLRQPHC